MSIEGIFLAAEIPVEGDPVCVDSECQLVPRKACASPLSPDDGFDIGRSWCLCQFEKG